MNKLDISYYTAHLEAPYCYGVHLELAYANNLLHCHMDLQYYGRENITEEELAQYGFSNSDDLSIDCKLPAIWWKVINGLYGDSELLVLEENQDTNLILSTELAGEQAQLRQPLNVEDWEFAIQELQQAIMEVSGSESPLNLTYRYCDESGNATNYDFQMKFADRTAKVSAKGIEKERSWEEAREMLEVLYSLDFQYEKATAKLPMKSGDWLHDTDGGWYKLYKDIKNFDETDQILSIIRFFKRDF